MGIPNQNGRWVFQKRVPKRSRHIDHRTFYRRALNTDSRQVSERKAPAIEAEIMAHWEALAAGRTGDAATRYAAAKSLATAQGFYYVHHSDIASLTVNERLARMEAALAAGNDVPEIATAILGGVDAPTLTFSEMADDYLHLTTDRLVGKSEGQAHRWRLSRERVRKSFISVVGNPPIDQVSRRTALDFRAWWWDRIQREGLSPVSANKDFSLLSEMWKTWTDLRGLDTDNPFARLSFKTTEPEKHPFSACWITSRLLAPGALDGLNAEARLPFLIMINTGCRPSEIVDADPDSWMLDHDIPHLSIRPLEGRAHITIDHVCRRGSSISALGTFTAPIRPGICTV